jgi:hypothetical protein
MYRMLSFEGWSLPSNKNILKFFNKKYDFFNHKILQLYGHQIPDPDPELNPDLKCWFWIQIRIETITDPQSL